LVGTLIAAAIGAEAGYFLARAIVLDRVEIGADQFVRRIEELNKSSSMQGQKALTALKSSPYPFCSDAEIGWMREMVYQSDFLNEVGRMRDGRILCSASRGRAVSSQVQYKPNLAEAGGENIYLNLPPFRRPGLTMIGIQTGDSYIVYRPNIEEVFASSAFHFAVTKLAGPAHVPFKLLGDLNGVPAFIMNQEGRTAWGGRIFATRCNMKYAVCVTGYMPISEAMHMGRHAANMTTAFGALFGATLSFICGFAYRRSRSMERQLRQAVRGEKLRVVYMPVVELNSRRIVGAEALARWDDEEGKPVSPEVFVRMAEENGFIGEITNLVVRRVLYEFGEHLRTHPEFRISFNATAADFADPEFLSMLDRNLRRAGVPAKNLVVEITESSTARQEVVKETLARLHQRGHLVHIDDFGTGYSSLSYLHELNADAIKIDKSFTKAIGTEAVTKTILPQIVAMVDSLGLDLIVEGVETEEQASYFTEMEKPRFAQGWLFGKPIPAGKFKTMLAEHCREKEANEPAAVS
jgi:sensor c-di-GMP phosphodiesterase-like protein